MNISLPEQSINLQSIERPPTTVDVVVFTILKESLHVLLVTRPDTPEEPFKKMWALPGGFIDVRQDIELECCALRKLQQKTGVQSPYLEQVGSWGGLKRDPRGWSQLHMSILHLYKPLKSSRMELKILMQRGFPLQGRV